MRPCRRKRVIFKVITIWRNDSAFQPEARQAFLRRFVVGVLGDEFALDGEGEDGFAEVGGGDGVGRVEEEREVGRGGRVGKAGQTVTASPVAAN
ncbi:hypothetical protein LBMAG49_04190 [Planctomycetota bacterium]|nr:hypothetical protein LBMAG49_04190 [Planctomycetota bacterium]